VVDFLLWALHAVSAPFNDVIGVFWINFVDVVKPTIRLRGVAGLDQRRTV
jgi:hypothetical protein